MSVNLKKRLSRIERKLDIVIASIPAMRQRGARENSLDNLIDRLHRASRSMLRQSVLERDRIKNRKS